MRLTVTVSLVVLAACGDNTVPGQASDATVPPTDSAIPVDTQQLVDTKFDTCSDTVKTIQPGAPTAAPASGWWSDDTRANGAVTVDNTFIAPPNFGCTSAHFVTGDSTPSPSADKAQLISFALAGTPLASITTISYWAYRSSASTGGAALDLDLNVTISGASVPNNFATLVYEPYNQSGQTAGILVDAWQPWNATALTTGDGLWWSSRVANPAPGSQSHPQPWTAFQALYPDAVVGGYGFDIGSVNPNTIVAGDGLVFGTTTTDF